MSEATLGVSAARDTFARVEGRKPHLRAVVHDSWFRVGARTPGVVTLHYVTPTDYATAELARWEQALRTQRELEEQLQHARQQGRPHAILDLMPQLSESRTRADLLLAEAVKVKCAFRDQRFITAWVSSTQSHYLDDGSDE